MRLIKSLTGSQKNEISIIKVAIMTIFIVAIAVACGNGLTHFIHQRHDKVTALRKKYVKQTSNPIKVTVTNVEHIPEHTETDLVPVPNGKSVRLMPTVDTIPAKTKVTLSNNVVFEKNTSAQDPEPKQGDKIVLRQVLSQSPEISFTGKLEGINYHFKQQMTGFEDFPVVESHKTISQDGSEIPS